MESLAPAASPSKVDSTATLVHFFAESTETDVVVFQLSQIPDDQQKR